MNQLSRKILEGDALPIEAFKRANLYDDLTLGVNGRMPILGTSTKIGKGTKVGYLTKVLYMMPAMTSGKEACGGRSAGCTAACLSEGTGHMSYPNVQRGRRRKHAAFLADRERFLADLGVEIEALKRAAIRAGMKPAVRLNGTTDIPWERYGIMERFPDVQFYDYTKLALKHRKPLDNYHLTFSISERKDADDRAAEYVVAGFSAAVVFAAKRGNLPATWRGVLVVDGDVTDARFLDPPGVYVGLSAKGRAKRDTTGFVKNPEGK